MALSATGGVITSAGLVLAATFGVLASLPLVFLVELGFAVALGVILDTIIVRSVLVTAINLDLGSKIWWPSKLDRGRPRRDAWPRPRSRSTAPRYPSTPESRLESDPEWRHDRDTITVTVMKLSTMLMYDGNPRDAADQVVELEKAGLDTVWVAEAYGFDSPTLMGYLAAKTETDRDRRRRSSTSTRARRRCSPRPPPGSTTSPAAARSSASAPPARR